MKIGTRLLLAIVALLPLDFAVAQDELEVPDFYAEPGLNPFRDYLNKSANEHIDPFSGSLQYHYVDLVVPGNGGLDIKVQRSYTAPQQNLGEHTPWGLHWTMHFGRVVKKDTAVCFSPNALNQNDNPRLELPDGSTNVLFSVTKTNQTDPDYITKDRWRADCTSATTSTGTNGAFRITSPEGTVYEMTQMTFATSSTYVNGALHNIPFYIWSPSRITDRNGNYLEFTYARIATSGPTLLDKITASDGRVVTFNYTNRDRDNALLTSVSANGQTWRYAYTQVFPPNDTFTNDYWYHLSEVQSPGGSNALVWKYDYFAWDAPPHLNRYALKTVTHPYGGKITYEYQPVRFDASYFYPTWAIYAKHVTSPDFWNISWHYYYKPGNSVYPPLPYDETFVAAPDMHDIRYRHYGVSSVSGDDIWKVGLPHEIERYTSGNLTETTRYDWDKQKISDENYRRTQRNDPYLVDQYIYAPVLARQTIKRDGTDYVTAYSNFDQFGNPRHIEEAGNGATIGGVIGSSPNRKTTELTYFHDQHGTDKWIINKIEDETISGVGQILRSYNAVGNLLRETKFGVQTNFTYHTNLGNGYALKSVTDARGKTTTYSDYKRGIPTLEQHPEGVSISRAVNNSGTIASETDGRGNTTQYQYDNLNRLVGITPARGAPIAITWPDKKRVLTRGDFEQSIDYDSYGRMIKQTVRDLVRGETITKNYTYDYSGRLFYESYPNHADFIAYYHDGLNRPTYMGFPDGGERRTSYLPGNKTVVKNERGFETTYSYRSFGNPDDRALVGVQAPEGVTTTLTRNRLNQIETIEQGGVVQRYEYDSRYFLTRYTTPEVGATQYGRDAVGNMISRQVAGNPAASYSYDGFNRLVAIDYPQTTPDVTLAYDGNGNLIRSTGGNVENRYAYDENNNLLSEILTIDGLTFTTEYAFDGNDQLTRMTYPILRTAVDYQPDAFGRPQRLGSFLTGVSYHPTGQPAAITYGNGATMELPLDVRKRPERLHTYMPNSGGIASIDYVYRYDRTNNVTSIWNWTDASFDRAMTYDGVDRLTGVSGPIISGSIAYDARGNITQKNVAGKSLSYSYDGASNKLVSISGTDSAYYTYDGYGNVTGNLRDSFRYDHAQNLVCANCGAADQAEYRYNAANLRVKASTNGVDRYFVYNRAGNLLLEYAPAANEFKEHLYLGSQRYATQAQDGELDSDRDGIMDMLELRAGLDPLDPADAQQDWDGDGLTNAQETAAGTNIRDADSDDDGLTDAQEVNLYGTNPLNADTDGDKIADGIEVQSGQNPLRNERRIRSAVRNVVNTLLLN